MSIVRKIKRAVRGEVAVTTAAKEVIRRGGVAISRSRERANLEQLEKAAPRLSTRFATASAADLLDHFRNRTTPVVLGFSQTSIADAQSLNDAEKIVDEHRWRLLGLGELEFGPEVNWHSDLLSGNDWPLEYHSSIKLIRDDGSDVRLVWELNRLPHLLRLACAYAGTRDERFSKEFFHQVASWREQNPYGYGVNWSCAMEVALRAMNLLAAFEVFRKSNELNEATLVELLALFDRHGTFIRQNLEFSYVATSNHYLSDVVGLVWLGTLMPELAAADEWREFALRETLREMDKQVLADGADFEASTGYHRFVTELLLYTFVLCRANGLSIPETYWTKLHDMVRYIRAYLRPDDYAPLIGDSDGGQVIPVRHRRGNAHAYVAAVGAVVFDDPALLSLCKVMPEEVAWVCGEEGVAAYSRLQLQSSQQSSAAFPHAGTYVLRNDDLFLVFNASNAGIHGRGSHGHNDALSIEVSAHGVPFIVDAGTFVYTADLNERHLFRSTAYHSTVQIDGAEQNVTDINQPFVIGNEAAPHVIEWSTSSAVDRVVAEHHGYERLTSSVTHRRTVTFHKNERCWLIEDELGGTGTHDVTTRFHFARGLDINAVEHGVVATHIQSGARLVVRALDVESAASFENQFTSVDYGEKTRSETACWKMDCELPVNLRWGLVAIAPGESTEQRLRSISDLQS